jgi:signal transduction histidine kinase
VIRVSVDADAIRLSVEDNGTGFDPATVRRESGLGLIGIRERVLDLGGTFELDTAPGRGTRLAVVLPASRTPDDTRHEPAAPEAGTLRRSNAWAS